MENNIKKADLIEMIKSAKRIYVIVYPVKNEDETGAKLKVFNSMTGAFLFELSERSYKDPWRELDNLMVEAGKAEAINDDEFEYLE